MLRTLVLLLLVANALFFAWTRGWLGEAASLHAGGEHEPERLRLENHAERLTLLNPQAARALQRQACLELPTLEGDDALHAAQGALERLGLSAADWSVQQLGAGAPQWVVATIKLGTRDFQARKEETYKKLKLTYEPLQGLPEEQPSLVLSRHDSQAAAAAALEALSQRALKGLRVLQLPSTQTHYSLQLPRADAPLQAQLLASKDAALTGFKACSTASGNGSAAPAASAPMASASAAASQP